MTQKIVRHRAPFYPAIQWTGMNYTEIKAWMNEALIMLDGSDLVIENRSGRSHVRLHEWIVRIDYHWLNFAPAVFDVTFEEVPQTS